MKNKKELKSLLLNILVMVGVAIVVQACTTLSSEVSLKKFASKDRLYAGKIRVNMSGDEHPRCEIYLNYDISPSIKLADDGVILYKTDRDSLRFRSIACFHKINNRAGAWHHRDLNLKGIPKSESNEVVSYFGDIELNWKIDTDLTLEASSQDTDSTKGVREGHVKDSGEMKITISNSKDSMATVLLERIPEAKDKKLVLQESLVSVKTE